jgi:hypothetical protein
MRVNQKQDLAFIKPTSDRGPKEVRGRNPWAAQPKPDGVATGPQINLMKQEVYVPGMGECACGCGHRPGCNDFLKIASVGEAD